jgi:outer membrane protein TolC
MSLFRWLKVALLTLAATSAARAQTAPLSVLGRAGVSGQASAVASAPRVLPWSPRGTATVLNGFYYSLPVAAFDDAEELPAALRGGTSLLPSLPADWLRAFEGWKTVSTPELDFVAGLYLGADNLRIVSDIMQGVAAARDAAPADASARKSCRACPKTAAKTASDKQSLWAEILETPFEDETGPAPAAKAVRAGADPKACCKEAGCCAAAGAAKTCASATAKTAAACASCAKSSAAAPDCCCAKTAQAACQGCASCTSAAPTGNAPSGNVIFGLGFNSDTGIVGRIVVNERNLDIARGIKTAMASIKSACTCATGCGCCQKAAPEQKPTAAAAELEREANNQLLNVTVAYWNLYQAYGSLYASEETLRVLHGLWIDSHDKAHATGKEPCKEVLAQIRGQYEEFRGERTNALAAVLEAERNLRGFLDLPDDDGTRLVPMTPPTLAPYKPNWEAALKDALSRRPELRLARENLRSHQAELARAQGAQPDLRFLARYDPVSGGAIQIIAGDTFIEKPSSPETKDTTKAASNGAFSSLNSAAPCAGCEDAKLRCVRLELCQAYEILKDQEDKVKRCLTQQYQTLPKWYRLIEDRRAERQAYADSLMRKLAAVESGKKSVDLDLLDIQRRLALAMTKEYQAIGEYNSTLARLAFARGTIRQHRQLVIAVREEMPARELSASTPLTHPGLVAPDDDLPCHLDVETQANRADDAEEVREVVAQPTRVVLPTGPGAWGPAMPVRMSVPGSVVAVSPPIPVLPMPTACPRPPLPPVPPPSYSVPATSSMPVQSQPVEYVQTPVVRGVATSGVATSNVRAATPPVEVPAPPAKQNVHLMTPHFEAHCDRLTSAGGSDHILLEGNVRLSCIRNGQIIQIQGQRVLVHLSDGTFTVDSAADTHQPPPAPRTSGIVPAGEFTGPLGHVDNSD